MGNDDGQGAMRSKRQSIGDLGACGTGRTSGRSAEQRRNDRADRLLQRVITGTEYERLEDYHALRHSFISILVAQGKTWDQIAAFVGHLDQRTTQRYIHFMPKISGKQRILSRLNFDLLVTLASIHHQQRCYYRRQVVC